MVIAILMKMVIAMFIAIPYAINMEIIAPLSTVICPALMALIELPRWALRVWLVCPHFAENNVLSKSPLLAAGQSRVRK